MPIDTGDKIYIHMPKTGGSWMSNYLSREHAGRVVGSHGHQPIYTIAKHALEGKLPWGTVRDPWSWYLSWWSHGVRSGNYGERLAVYGGGSTEFKDVLMGALSRDPERCPEHTGGIWSLHNEKQARQDYLGGLGGLYTWAFFHIFGTEVRTFVDMNRMHEGVEELFGAAVDSNLYPPANTRTHKLPKSPDEMYDEEMIDAVYDEDSFLISHLGFEEPFSSLPEPVFRA